MTTTPLERIIGDEISREEKGLWYIGLVAMVLSILFGSLAPIILFGLMIYEYK